MEQYLSYLEQGTNQLYYLRTTKDRGVLETVVMTFVWGKVVEAVTVRSAKAPVHRSRVFAAVPLPAEQRKAFTASLKKV